MASISLTLKRSTVLFVARKSPVPSRVASHFEASVKDGDEVAVKGRQSSFEAVIECLIHQIRSAAPETALEATTAANDIRQAIERQGQEPKRLGEILDIVKWHQDIQEIYPEHDMHAGAECPCPVCQGEHREPTVSERRPKREEARTLFD